MGSYTRALLVSQDRRHLFVTPLLSAISHLVCGGMKGRSLPPHLGSYTRTLLVSQDRPPSLSYLAPTMCGKEGSIPPPASTCRKEGSSPPEERVVSSGCVSSGRMSGVHTGFGCWRLKTAKQKHVCEQLRTWRSLCRKQCCGSGSGIRCLFDPWIRDPD